MKVKFRVDTMPAGTLERNLKLEDFLDSIGAEGWEVVSVTPCGAGMVLVISRRVKRWWQ